jgi:hypothetical protein
MSFIARWTAIASALGLNIQCPVEVTLPDGRTVKAPVLLRNFGWENGMVLFGDTPSDIFEIVPVLVDMGYGFSCLGPYRDDELNLELVKEMLADWTWSGPPEQRPSWLAGPPSDEGDSL